MDKVTVTGAKWFKGSIDGKNLDVGTVYVDERLDDRRGTAAGRASTPYRVSSSAIAQALSRGKFPMVCEVEFDRVTDGKGDSTTIIVDIRPPDAVSGPQKVRAA